MTDALYILSGTTALSYTMDNMLTNMEPILMTLGNIPCFRKGTRSRVRENGARKFVASIRSSSPTLTKNKQRRQCLENRHFINWKMVGDTGIEPVTPSKAQ
jgi:hypothetical protein